MTGTAPPATKASRRAPAAGARVPGAASASGAVVMQLIPVIDLKGGQVVHAQRGDRQAYRPVVSALCQGSAPVTVAAALCRHCASPRLYVADLDALMGSTVQTQVLRALLEALPGIELWLDAGFADAAAAAALAADLADASARVVPVFASEALRSREAMREACARPGAVLSLDRRDGRPLDRAGCWDAPDDWPASVIMMTLERVGAGAGPDLDTLRLLRMRSPRTRIIGAGGIRDARDVEVARAAGAHAWLVASALHDGRLPAAAA